MCDERGLNMGLGQVSEGSLGWFLLLICTLQWSSHPNHGLLDSKMLRGCLTGLPDRVCSH